MINSKKYIQQLKIIAIQEESLLRCFQNKRVFITGICGLIGSYVADLLFEANKVLGLNCNIFGVDRDEKLINERFSKNNNVFCLDINNLDSLPDISFDYVMHTASNTSPIDYGTKPIDTISTIVLGTKNILDYCIKTKSKKMLFCSSVEVYGSPIEGVDSFDEEYNGFLNINKTRSGYPASKRCVESLLNAYADEHENFSFVTARIARIYGPTKIPGDTKVVSQFIDNVVDNENIVLKSSGEQVYTFGYVGNCALALLYLLVFGKNREAFNVGDYDSTMSLKDYALKLSKIGGVNIEFAKQNAIEQKSYSKVSKATMSLKKIKSLGWEQTFSFENGIVSTIAVLRELKENGEKI